MLRLYPVILSFVADIAELVPRIAHHDPDLARQLLREVSRTPSSNRRTQTEPSLRASEATEHNRRSRLRRPGRRRVRRYPEKSREPLPLCSPVRSGRDGPFGPPPGQNPASGFPAPGSHLGSTEGEALGGPGMMDTGRRKRE